MAKPLKKNVRDRGLTTQRCRTPAVGGKSAAVTPCLPVLRSAVGQMLPERHNSMLWRLTIQMGEASLDREALLSTEVATQRVEMSGIKISALRMREEVGTLEEAIPNKVETSIQKLKLHQEKIACQTTIEKLRRPQLV